jgi:signal transduction histidine kinase
VSRNLITRMGLASGVVAALVAAVFLVLVNAVQDQQDATSAARRAEQVVDAATRARQSPTAANVQRLGQLVREDRVQSERVARLAAAPDGPRAQPLLDAIISTEQARADNRRDLAQSKADLATALAIGGLVGSVALIALLTSYLIRYIVVPVRRTGRAARRLATGDLTVRVPEEGDDEPVELARAFNAMADSLQESERLKDEFFALVSHELRTPLTSIIGYLELLIEQEVGEVPPDQLRFLGIIERNARRLQRLVGDLLFVAQIEAGTLSLEKRDVDLEAVVTDAVAAGRPRAEQAGVELKAETENLPPLQGDPDRLAQVVDNLVTNAVKFTPAGGSVVVRAGPVNGAAVIEVSDTGIGIPAADREQVFERFYRTQTATEQSIPGIGLGLSIVQAIAAGHGGSVGVESEEGRGTTFTVELPIPIHEVTQR